MWEAWSYGTMGPDDFLPVAEDSDRLTEIVEAALAPAAAAINAQALELDQARPDALSRGDALAALQKRARAMEASLEWYASMAKRMGDAALRSDSQAMLTLMKEIAVDYGGRARTALSGESQ